MIPRVSNLRRSGARVIRASLTGCRSGLENTPLVRSVHRLAAASLCVLLALGVPSMTAAGDLLGVLDGRVKADPKRLTDYAVQLRDAQTGKLLKTVPVDAQGVFAAKDVPVGKPYLLELIRASAKNSPLVCTAGPYQVSPDPKIKTNARLDCGRLPAAFWVLAAAAGMAGSAAVMTRSVSQ